MSSMLSCLLGLTLLNPAPMRVLFCGNSHTSVNDVPMMVGKLLEDRGTSATTNTMLGGLLLDMGSNPAVRTEVGSGKYAFVVLQGAGLSSSHKYKYSQAGGIELAKLAVKANSKPLLYAEWSRRGISETDYILGIYGEIARASGARVVPVCRAWDAALAKQPRLDLWADDGNHAKLAGSYLAALTIAEFISPSKAAPRWRPQSIDPGTGMLLYKSALSASRPNQR